MISIIIPSYNHEKYIRSCIDSVLQQTYQDFELIIIDDGSKDTSDEIISSYDDSRIIYLKQENAGAHHTINRGLDLARGEYLTILNSDDEYHSERLEQCLKIFDNSPSVDFISSWINIIDSVGKQLAVKMAWQNMEPWPIKNKSLTFADTLDYRLNALMSNFVSTTSNMIFRRCVYEKIGGMRNLRFAHDWDFLLRACAHFNCHNLEQALLNYRIHNTNTISSNRGWMLFEICWILAANIDRFSEELVTSLEPEELMGSTIKILESFNFQGNDKVFWLLYWQINTLKKRGIENPEELYLSDMVLRESILKYIQV